MWLLCDDDTAVLELLCDILLAKGYEVVPVTNGRAARSALSRNRSILLLAVDFTIPASATAENEQFISTLRVSAPRLSRQASSWVPIGQ
jgi:DNA-binding response OmpR family regulator